MNDIRLDVRVILSKKRLMFKAFRSIFKRMLKHGKVELLFVRFEKMPTIFYAIPIMIIAVGLRLRNYIANRALWLDEATLSLNIIKRSYAELLEPLDTLQVAPIGFLMVERFFVELLGPGEYALRLLPFIAGILSILLFYSVAKRLTSGHIAILASVLFAFSYYLIYYTVEVKQYILDVFFLLIIIRFIYIPHQIHTSSWRYVVSGLIGAIAIWFSNASVFMLAGVGIWLVVVSLRSRSAPKIVGFLMMGVLWMGSFSIYYILFIRNHPHSNLQVDAFRSIQYLPGTQGLTGTFRWIIENLGGLFIYGIGRTGGIIGIFLTLIAFYFIYKRKDYLSLVLIIPIIIHLVFSLFSIYPFGRRFTLYIIPIAFIYMSYGLYHLLGKSKISLILISTVLIVMVFDHFKLSMNPIMKQEIREPMQYINEHYQEGDIIYVQYGSRWAFEYYRDQYIDPDRNYYLGTWIRSNPEAFKKELNILSENNRIWVLFSNYYPQEKEMVLEGCGQYGDQIDIYESVGSTAYLFGIGFD